MVLDTLQTISNFIDLDADQNWREKLIKENKIEHKQTTTKT